jgi:hypothetical protein
MAVARNREGTRASNLLARGSRPAPEDPWLIERRRDVT